MIFKGRVKYMSRKGGIALLEFKRVVSQRVELSTRLAYF